MRRAYSRLVMLSFVACAGGCASNVDGGAASGGQPNNGAGGIGGASRSGGNGGGFEPVDCEELCEVNEVEKCTSPLYCEKECAVMQMFCPAEGAAFLQCIAENMLSCQAVECLPPLESFIECADASLCYTLCAGGLPTWSECSEYCFGMKRRAFSCYTEEGSSTSECRCSYGGNPRPDGEACEGQSGFDGCCAEFYGPSD